MNTKTDHRCAPQGAWNGPPRPVTPWAAIVTVAVVVVLAVLS